jgi:hypothetical protein
MPSTRPERSPRDIAIEEGACALALSVLTAEGELRHEQPFDAYDLRRLQILFGLIEGLTMKWTRRVQAGVKTTFTSAPFGIQMVLDSLRRAHTAGSTLLVKAGYVPCAVVTRIVEPVYALTPDPTTLDLLLDYYNIQMGAQITSEALVQRLGLPVGATARVGEFEITARPVVPCITRLERPETDQESAKLAQRTDSGPVEE